MRRIILVAGLVLLLLIPQLALADEQPGVLLGYYTSTGHYRTDHKGGWYLPGGGHIQTDHMGGWYLPGGGHMQTDHMDGWYLPDGGTICGRDGQGGWYRR